MVSTAMTITASRATTNPTTSPVVLSGRSPEEPGVGSSVVEVVLDVLGEDVEEWTREGVEEWGGAGVEEWAGEGVEEWASEGVEEWAGGGVEESVVGGVEEATKFIKTEKVKEYALYKMLCMPYVAQ